MNRLEFSIFYCVGGKSSPLFFAFSIESISGKSVLRRLREDNVTKKRLDRFAILTRPLGTFRKLSGGRRCLSWLSGVSVENKLLDCHLNCGHWDLILDRQKSRKKSRGGKQYCPMFSLPSFRNSADQTRTYAIPIVCVRLRFQRGIFFECRCDPGENVPSIVGQMKADKMSERKSAAGLSDI